MLVWHSIMLKNHSFLVLQPDFLKSASFMRWKKKKLPGGINSWSYMRSKNRTPKASEVYVFPQNILVAKVNIWQYIPFHCRINWLKLVIWLIIQWICSHLLFNPSFDWKQTVRHSIFARAWTQGSPLGLGDPRARENAVTNCWFPIQWWIKR